MWNCEPCTPVKYGPGVHSCHCLPFFGLAPLCYMSLSPYVFVATFIHSFFWQCIFFFFKVINGAARPIFNSSKGRCPVWRTVNSWWETLESTFWTYLTFYFLHSGDIKDHQLLLYPNLLFYVLTPAGFSTVRSHSVLRHLVLWYCVYNLFHNIFCHLVMHSTELLMPLKPRTIAVGERQCVRPLAIKSLQDYIGLLLVNSESSLWWCRHSSLLSQRASLNLTTSPYPGLYCSAGLMLNGN